MTSAKRGISIMLIAALVISMFMAFSAVNANAMAKKKCNHKNKVTTYTKSGSKNTHTKVVKCKKCGAIISAKTQNCFSYDVKKTYSKKNQQYHNVKMVCPCGRKKTQKEEHYLVGVKNWEYARCTRCGIKDKTIRFEAVGLPD